MPRHPLAVAPFRSYFCPYNQQFAGYSNLFNIIAWPQQYRVVNQRICCGWFKRNNCIIIIVEWRVDYIDKAVSTMVWLGSNTCSKSTAEMISSFSSVENKAETWGLNYVELKKNMTNRDFANKWIPTLTFSLFMIESEDLWLLTAFLCFVKSI